MVANHFQFFESHLISSVDRAESLTIIELCDNLQVAISLLSLDEPELDLL